MTACPFTGSARRRARAAGPPAPLPPPPCAPPGGPPCPRPRGPKPRPPARAEPLEPRRLLAVFTVTTTADAGPGSLRQAILDANAAAGADSIHFAIVGDAGTVHTIRPLSALPGITDPATLDATTQPGYTTHPLIELDGSAAGADVDGLTFLARPTVVRGLAINRFSRHGVAARQTDGALFRTNHPFSTVDGCRIGTNPAGDVALPNGGHGVLVAGPAVEIGSPPFTGRMNVISGNALSGVAVVGAIRTESQFDASVVIGGNRIGTNADGTAALGNGRDGVLIDRSPLLVHVNSPSAPLRMAPNLISGNGASGVRIIGPINTQGATWGGGVTVFDNRIGTDAAGTRAIPNGQVRDAPRHDGVTFSGRGGLRVEANTISGNPGSGIRVDGDNDYRTTVHIVNNRIGTDATGAARLGNGGDGVFAGGAEELKIESNTVAANHGNGIVVAGESLRNNGATVSGNYVGSNRAGAALGNAGHGIVVPATRSVLVGGPNPLYSRSGGIFIPMPAGTTQPPNTYQNVIAANGGHGILVAGVDDVRLGSDVRTTTVWSNHIGMDRTGLIPLGNAGSGIYLSGTTRAVIGAPADADVSQIRDARTGNVIGNNGGDGVTVVGRTTWEPHPNYVAGNRIGVGYDPAQPSRIVPMGNRGHGVSITDATHFVVAPFPRGATNVIAHNTGAGVAVRSVAAPAEFVRIDRNSIFSNGGLGIDLGADGVTRNDHFDIDRGPNRRQNHPAVTSVETIDGTTRVRVTMQGMPARPMAIDLYSNAAPDPSGFGEGETFLASSTTDLDERGIGFVTFTLPAIPVGRWLTATATEMGYWLGVWAPVHTSEFSPAVQVSGDRPIHRPLPARHMRRLPAAGVFAVADAAAPPVVPRTQGSERDQPPPPPRSVLAPAERSAYLLA